MKKQNAGTRSVLCVGLLIGWLAAVSGSFHAQMMPFHANSAMAVGFENRALRSFVTRIEMSGLTRDGRSLPDPSQRRMTVTGAPLVVPYAVHRTLIPIVMIPFLSKRLAADTAGGRRTTVNRGMGDATLLLKFVPVQWDGRNETRRIAFFGGVKLPTGTSDRTGLDGNLLPAPLQLGTGAYEVPLGLAFSVQTPGRIGLVTDFFYRINTPGNATSGRDSFSYDVAVGWRALPERYRNLREQTLNLYLELNGRHENEDGDTLLIAPGLQWIVRQNLALETSVQWPLRQHYRTARMEIDRTVSAGFRWMLPF